MYVKSNQQYIYIYYNYVIRTNLVTSKASIILNYYRPSQEEQDKLTDYLLGLGATEVVTEEFAASHRMKEMMQVRIIARKSHLQL